METLPLPTPDHDEAALFAWVEQLCGGPIVASSRSSGGNRCRSWAIDVAAGPQIQKVFLRYAPPRPPSVEPYTIRREADVYRAIAQAGLLAPRLLGEHPTLPAILTERAPGIAEYRRLRDPATAQAIAAAFMAQLARLHRTDITGLHLAGGAQGTRIADHTCAELAIWRAMYAETARPDPLIDLALDWLEHAMPDPDGPVVLVHGDAGPGNFLFQHGALTAVIDWELAHLGDPMEDIAWLSMRCVMEPVPDFPAALAAYVQAGGVPIDRARIRYHRVLVSTRVVIIRHRNVTGEPGHAIVSEALNRRLLVEALADASYVDRDLPATPRLPAQPPRRPLHPRARRPPRRHRPPQHRPGRRRRRQGRRQDPEISPGPRPLRRRHARARRSKPRRPLRRTAKRLRRPNRPPSPTRRRRLRRHRLPPLPTTGRNRVTFTPEDDRFHFAAMGDRWWMTETAWFSFCHPERRLGGWLYTMARPNIGTVAGGAWVWDDTAHLPWEVRYNANYTAMRLPRDQDLTDITLPTGVSIKMLEPCTRYRLGFDDEDRCTIALDFAAIMPPRPLRRAGSPFGQAHHYDQFGHVTGHVTLGTEHIAIDCLAMRDRSWGPRPEHRPHRSAYVTGIATERDAFLAVTSWEQGREIIAYGFLTQDGETADLVSGHRTVEHDPANGWVTTITIEAIDDRGRRLHATGRRLSGIIINRHSFIDSNGLIAWTINGHPGHGEDQDMWPIHDWAAARRANRPA